MMEMDIHRKGKHDEIVVGPNSRRVFLPMILALEGFCRS